MQFKWRLISPLGIPPHLLHSAIEAELGQLQYFGISAFCFDPVWQKRVNAEHEESTTKELF